MPFQTKLFEIRDNGTLIPAMAVKIVGSDAPEDYLFRRAGWGPNGGILLINLNDGKSQVDPYKWTYGRTMRQAHLYLEDRFDSHDSGNVIDVEFILGETTKHKTSEQPQTV